MQAGEAFVVLLQASSGHKERNKSSTLFILPYRIIESSSKETKTEDNHMCEKCKNKSNTKEPPKKSPKEPKLLI